MKYYSIIYLAGYVLLSGLFFSSCKRDSLSDKVVSYIADPQKQKIEFYWKNDSTKLINSLQNLKDYVSSKGCELSFAMNAGMFHADFYPVGLFIQEGTEITPINKEEMHGNFYMQPNGIFYITDQKKAEICQTKNFVNNPNIRFATQSGPMLVFDGEIHPAFNKDSQNYYIRNGVGILPNGDILFAISKRRMTLYNFALFFKEQGCKNALYLDGHISRAYIPSEDWIQLDGNFAVMIGITKAKED